MDTCASCQGELAPQWKFCVHCGTSVPVRTIPADGLDVTATADTASAPEPEAESEPKPAPEPEPEPETDTTATAPDDPAPDAPAPDAGGPQRVPSALRTGPPAPAPRRRRRRMDGRLMFGIAATAVGLIVVLYAVIGLLGASG